MTFLTLREIKAKVDQLAEIIGASQDILPTYGSSNQTGHPHIELGSQGYYYLVLERDTVCDRLITVDIDELLYKIFANVTFELAQKYELSHRIKNQDSRRISFEKQVEYLSMLSSQWGERESREHEQILKQHPFDDYASVRATLTKELREQGNSDEFAWNMACEKYPLPKNSEE
jgi:hypothetical protein